MLTNLANQETGSNISETVMRKLVRLPMPYLALQTGWPLSLYSLSADDVENEADVLRAAAQPDMVAKH